MCEGWCVILVLTSRSHSLQQLQRWSTLQQHHDGVRTSNSDTEYAPATPRVECTQQLQKLEYAMQLQERSTLQYLQ